MLEFLYPLLQGYDSVALKADVEIGGTDQKFNLLVGRDIQGQYEQEPQVVITMPLMEGLDGVQKMSKSLGNYVGINESPKEIFGKLMSVSDDLMYKYYELLTDEDAAKIREAVKNKSLHPKDAKKNLAKMIVAQYCGEEEASRQEGEFETAFKDKGFPTDVELKEIAVFGDSANLVSFIADKIHLLGSRGEAKRKIKAGAVEVDGTRVVNIDFELKAGKEYKIRVGKKFARVLLKKA